MNKIKVRCVRGFGIIGSHFNVEVLKPIPGFGYSKKLYCCDNCGEMFVFDLDNPELKGSREIPENLDELCPRCQKQISGHLLPYPENVFLSGSIKKIDKKTISFDQDSSLVKEFWAL